MLIPMATRLLIAGSADTAVTGDSVSQQVTDENQFRARLQFVLGGPSVRLQLRFCVRRVTNHQISDSVDLKRVLQLVGGMDHYYCTILHHIIRLLTLTDEII